MDDPRPPRPFTSGGMRLSRRLDERRSECRRRALAGDRVATLEALGTEWDPRGVARARGLQRKRRHSLPMGHIAALGIEWTPSALQSHS
ncbi:MAG TPA: helicase associated domain-containing protein [Pseudonocardia sp.]|nr:helicase associated domain-containing protein [Pseudonocardia sp.]